MRATQPRKGIVTDKYTGEALIFHLGEIKMLAPIQTGFVLVVNGKQIAVSKEKYEQAEIGEPMSI